MKLVLTLVLAPMFALASTCAFTAPVAPISPAPWANSITLAEKQASNGRVACCAAQYQECADFCSRNPGGSCLGTCSSRRSSCDANGRFVWNNQAQLIGNASRWVYAGLTARVHYPKR
jgi:hypothetical protein